MIQSISELAASLAGTTLAERMMLELPILDTDEKAYALKISGDEVESAWRIARACLSQTQRWPVAVGSWVENWSKWPEQIARADFFSRFYYEEAPNPVDISPRGLCRLADRVDVPAFLERMAWDRTQEKALYGDWGDIDPKNLAPEDARLPWYQPPTVALLFLPTIHCWDTLAYLNWFGTSDYGAEYYIALGRSWEKRFGAELVAHYGTILQCLVSRPPQILGDAETLAQEHDLASPCTLAQPGLHILDYAKGLVGCDRWALQENP